MPKHVAVHTTNIQFYMCIS